MLQPSFYAERVSPIWFKKKIGTWPNDTLVSEYQNAVKGVGNYKYCLQPKLMQLSNILGREIYNRGLDSALITA